MPIFADYRPPAEALEAAANATSSAPVIEGSWLALVEHWALVVADLSLHCGVDLHDPAVLARPWPGIRTMIFSLLDSPTRLRAALTRR